MKPIVQLLHFGYHQAMSCIFPVAIFGTLAVSSVIEVPFIYRYDAILLILLAVQYVMDHGHTLSLGLRNCQVCRSIADSCMQV